jgi:hypothetical protein
MAVNQPRWSDVARQFAVVFGAIFQIYASYGVGRSVGAIAQELRSLITPATYAFSIWGPIFILCLAYGIYQALPAQRENSILRAIGWWTAGAFIANGAWSYIFTNRQFILAEAILLAGFVFVGGAYLRYAREAPATRASNFGNRLIGPTLGLLFGWLTAASAVGLASTLISQGFAATGQGAEIGGGALLLAGGAVACFVILASRDRPYSTWIAYGAALLWALAGVVIEQRSASNITISAALIAAALVLLVMFSPGAVRSRPLSGSLTPLPIQSRGSVARQMSPPETQ